MEIKTGLSFLDDNLVLFQKMSDEEQKRWDEEIAEKDRQVLEEKKQYAYTHDSGVKQRYWNESLDTYKAETPEEKKNLEYIRKFCKNETKPMILIIGKYGTGKTHLGCGIVRETYGTFISSFELCLLYEMGSDYKADLNKMQVLDKYSKEAVLVIDEVGRGKADIEKQILPYIINERYERQKRTVLISNLEKEQVMELLGGATIDRLKEVCATLTFNGESRRK